MAGYTPVPNTLLDEWLPFFTDPELRVLLYVLRRTEGFGKDSDAISLSQFTHGITTRDGRVLDQGCGVRNRTRVSQAIQSLKAKGWLQVHKHQAAGGEAATSSYAVVVPDRYHVVPERYQGVVPEPGPRVVPGRHPQKKAQKKEGDQVLWTSVLERLETQMTTANYRTWLAETHPLGRRGSTLVVGAPSEFVREWLQTRFRLLVRRVVQELDAQLTDVTFEVAAREQMA